MAVVPRTDEDERESKASLCSPNLVEREPEDDEKMKKRLPKRDRAWKLTVDGRIVIAVSPVSSKVGTHYLSGSRRTRAKRIDFEPWFRNASQSTKQDKHAAVNTYLITDIKDSRLSWLDTTAKQNVHFQKHVLVTYLSGIRLKD